MKSALTREKLRKSVIAVCEQQGADQPAHMCRLISTFVIRFLEVIKSKLATVKFQFSS